MSTHTDAVKATDVEPVAVETTYVQGKSGDYGQSTFAKGNNGASDGATELRDESEAEQQITRKKEWFGYFKTKQFWIVLVAG
jgi:hypothetical protein